MSTIEAQNQYTLDRKAAARLLNVSIRTLDRYIGDRKVSTRLVGGRVWLDKGELMRFRRTKERPVDIDKVDMSTSDLSIDVDVDNVDKVEFVERENVHPLSTQDKERGSADAVFQKLYLDLKQELEQKQERLEMANYRVGQLENQVRNSVPMLEYHRENEEKKKKQQELKQEIDKGRGLITTLSKQLKVERFGKNMFLVILLLILALQPLWLLLLYK